MSKTLYELLTKNPKIGIFGLGKSNLGVVEFLRQTNLPFTLTVRSDSPITEKVPPFTSHLLIGKDAYTVPEEEIIFLSPTVRRDIDFFKKASERGIILSSDSELFFELNRDTVYVITGSDGKSSTSYLIASMLRGMGHDAIPSGNFGLALSPFIGKGKTVAAELSSFQLMHLIPKCRRAVITNITPNHLDWHKNINEYISAKLNAAKRCGGLVIDYDSKLLRINSSGYPLFCAVSSSIEYKDLKVHIDAENYVTLCGDTVYLNGNEYFSVKNAKKKESYSIKNYMLSAAAVIGDCDKESIERAVNTFCGLSHRAETVTTKNGITYIDSSIDSTPDRTLSTLSSLRGDVAVIIGGKGKGLSLKALADALPHLTVGACLMGEVGEELSELLVEEPRYKIRHADNMTDAVKAASSLLTRGGTVILSPAATSFDKYKNFEQRGDDFKENCPKN